MRGGKAKARDNLIVKGSLEFLRIHNRPETTQSKTTECMHVDNFSSMLARCIGFGIVHKSAYMHIRRKIFHAFPLFLFLFIYLRFSISLSLSLTMYIL